MIARPQKITFGAMRAGLGGTRDILVDCLHCGHHVEMNADRWADDVRLSDIEGKFLCKACGKRGADVRPHHRLPKMGV